MIEKIIKIAIVCFTIIGFSRLASIIIVNRNQYIIPYYTESVYKQLEAAFDSSQYRKVNNPGIIPDETVFSYAAGAYLRGVDPILINSEHTPLGKYILALSILLFKNDKLVIPIFGIFSIFTVWLVAKNILHDPIIALAPAFLLAIEPLFINQFQYTPLLDVIQLPFIYLSMYFFIKEFRKKYFWMTGICLGLVMATKTVVPAVLLSCVFLGTLVLYKKFRAILVFISCLSLSAGVFILSYIKTFLDGYSIMDFIGFQKWIFLYQKSKLLYPFSVWKLIYLNRWQTWWGDFRELRAEDWTIVWPIIFSFGFIAMGYAWVKRKSISLSMVVLLLWILLYELFLSLGVVTSRFFLPLLPALYIVVVYMAVLCIKRFFYFPSIMKNFIKKTRKKHI